MAIAAQDFLQAAGERGFRLYSGVPCSYLTPFIDAVIGSPDLRYVGAANEGEAVAVAAGAELGGTPAVAMFQNSGLGNAVSPLTSLTWTFRLPVLLIPTLRAEPGGAPDEPQHELMGAITGELLELMKIPWEFFPTEPDDIGPALDRAVEFMRSRRTPYALVMRRGSVERQPADRPPQAEPWAAGAPGTAALGPAGTRRELLQAIQAGARPTDVVLATTGYTGRELYACGDRENQLYQVGSMGCASSLGLGLAIARPERRVVVIDGDGAALMRMGALATLGHERPPNLVHVLLDNGLHESTGGQPTVSRSIDLCAVAGACGYPRSERAATPAAVTAFLAAAGTELSFLHVPILPGVPAQLPRPSISPAEVAERLRAFLGAA